MLIDVGSMGGVWRLCVLLGVADLRVVIVICCFVIGIAVILVITCDGGLGTRGRTCCASILFVITVQTRGRNYRCEKWRGLFRSLLPSLPGPPFIPPSPPFPSSFLSCPLLPSPPVPQSVRSKQDRWVWGRTVISISPGGRAEVSATFWPIRRNSF